MVGHQQDNHSSVDYTWKTMTHRLVDSVQFDNVFESLIKVDDGRDFGLK